MADSEQNEEQDDEREPKKKRSAGESFTDLIQEGHRVAQLYRREGELMASRVLTTALLQIEEAIPRALNPELDLDHPPPKALTP